MEERERERVIKCFFRHAIALFSQSDLNSNTTSTLLILGIIVIGLIAGFVIGVLAAWVMHVSFPQKAFFCFQTKNYRSFVRYFIMRLFARIQRRQIMAKNLAGGAGSVVVVYRSITEHIGAILALLTSWAFGATARPAPALQHKAALSTLILAAVKLMPVEDGYPSIIGNLKLALSAFVIAGATVFDRVRNYRAFAPNREGRIFDV